MTWTNKSIHVFAVVSILICVLAIIEYGLKVSGVVSGLVADVLKVVAGCLAACVAVWVTVVREDLSSKDEPVGIKTKVLGFVGVCCVTISAVFYTNNYTPSKTELQRQNNWTNITTTLTEIKNLHKLEAELSWARDSAISTWVRNFPELTQPVTQVSNDDAASIHRETDGLDAK
ncbi:hypothetical protein V866_004792 [Kwoniella sp. B9012]